MPEACGRCGLVRSPHPFQTMAESADVEDSALHAVEKHDDRGSLENRKLDHPQKLLTEHPSIAPATAAELLHRVQAWFFRRNRQSSIAAQDQDGPHGRRD